MAFHYPEPFIITWSLSRYDLTHCSRDTSKMIIGKQCRPRSDAAVIITLLVFVFSATEPFYFLAHLHISTGRAIEVWLSSALVKVLVSF